MDNKTLATELITRCAGFTSYFRGMIQEAARRLLQMVPDHPAKAGAMEADSLRQLAAEWPVTNKPPCITSDEWLRCVCTAAADRIEQMSETIDYGRKIQAERDALKIDKLNLISMVEQLEKIRAERDSIVAYIKKGGCACNLCKHCACDPDDEPCASCFTGQNYPKWEWEGENHG